MEKQFCKATSKQSGARCKRYAIPGGSVCHYHGGAAPQVQRSARERLAAMVDPALNVIARVLSDSNDATALAAARDVLDRNGYKPTDKIDLKADISTSPTVIALADVLSLEQLETLRERAIAKAGEAPSVTV